MATAENPFPDKKKSKNASYVSGLYNTVGATTQPQAPLYYEETINASIYRNNDEMTFDQSEHQSMKSGLTGSSSTTFRDTQIDQLQSDHLMHVQNLSSIVNNPKKKGMLQKAKDLYLQQTGKKTVFRVLTEDTVEDSALIPKVNPAKDFKLYLRALQESNIAEYMANHPRKVEEVDPFSTARDASPNVNNSSLEAVALTLRKSSSTRRSQTSDLNTLPSSYFSEDFRVPPRLFQIQTPEDVVNKTEELNKQLEIVERHLTINLGENFEQFNRAFESFTGMKRDLKQIQTTINSQKQLLQQVKQGQLQSLNRLGQLNQLRIKKQKVKDLLRQLVVLKQTVPIVQKLIQSSGNFQIALELIQNAQNVCRTLNLDIASTILIQLQQLQTDCAKKLESESLKLIQTWLESLIFVTMNPSIAPNAYLFTKSDLLLNWCFPQQQTVNSPYTRLQQLINSMLRTNEIDQFLRQLKVFALQHAKKLYSQLIEQINEPEAKKKDAFKNCVQKRESILTLVLMGHTQASALQNISALVQQTCVDYYNVNAKERQAERKAELQLKHISDELNDCIVKTRFYYQSKIESCYNSACQDVRDISEFCELQSFGTSIADGLRASNFQVQQLQKQVQQVGQQFVLQISQESIEQLKKTMSTENWQHAPCQLTDQLITLKINTLDHSQIVEPSVVSDYIESSRGKYKVVNSCFEFQRHVFKFVNVAREIAHLQPDATLAIEKLVKEFNGTTFALILGQGAHKNGQLTLITSKHLCLSHSCIQFAHDQLEFIQSQLSINIKEPSDQQSLEFLFQKLQTDLATHLNSIQNQLVDILVQDWRSKLSTVAPANQPDDTASKQIQDILKSKMKMFSIVKAEGQPSLLLAVFREAMRQLANEIDSTYLKVNGENKQRVKTDLLALQQSLSNLEIDPDITTVIRQKITSLLLSRCGYDQSKVFEEQKALEEPVAVQISPTEETSQDAK